MTPPQSVTGTGAVERRGVQVRVELETIIETIFGYTSELEQHIYSDWMISVLPESEALFHHGEDEDFPYSGDRTLLRRLFVVGRDDFRPIDPSARWFVRLVQRAPRGTANVLVSALENSDGSVIAL